MGDTGNAIRFRAATILDLLMALTLAVIWLDGPAAAGGRVALLQATPVPGSTVFSSPFAVVLWFDKEIDPNPTRVSVHVVGPGGDRAEPLGILVDPADPKQLDVPVKALVPGTYRVIWQVAAVDDSRGSGAFDFVLAQR